MKKPKLKLIQKKLSRADVAHIKKRLRYMDPKNIRRDFRSPEQQAAIAAVFSWMGLHSVIAWRIGKHGHVATVARSSTVRRPLGSYNALVIDKEAYQAAETLLVPQRPKAPGAHPRKTHTMTDKKTPAPKARARHLIAKDEANTVVTIREGHWVVTTHSPERAGRRTTSTAEFPISGKGMSAHFAQHGIRHVQTGSSVGFPREDGARVSGDQAHRVLEKALAW